MARRLSSQERAIAGGVAAGAIVGLAALLLALPYVRGERAEQDPSPPQPIVSSNAPSPVVEPAAGNTPGPQAAPTPPPVDIAGLQSLLEKEAAGLRGKVGIHVRVDGEGDLTAGVNPDEQMRAASIIKLPLMAVVFASWESGFLKRAPADEKRVRQMITVSDNPGADALIRRLTREQVNTWLDNHGYTDTELRHLLLGPRPEGENVVTAAEMTRMLLQILRGELVSAEASAEMRQILLDQTRRTRIPEGLPEGVAVGNKTGTLNRVVNDVAFIEVPGGLRYTMAVLNEGGNDVPTSRRIARLSRRVYEHLTRAPEAAGNASSPAANSPENR